MSLSHDLRHAVRQIYRSPGFALTVVLTLAVGIGASAAMFTVVNGVLLTPIAYTDAQDRVVVLAEGIGDGRRHSVALQNYADWQARARSFSAMGLFRSEELNMVGGSEPLTLTGAVVGAGAFRALGLNPVLGRAFTDADDVPGAEATVILRADLWRQVFDGRSDVVGRTVTLDGVPHTIVGVMPQRARFPSDTTQLWVPFGPMLAANPRWINREDHMGFYGVARLAPGVTMEAAQREMTAIAAQLGAEYPASNKNSGVRLSWIYDEEVGGAKTTLLVLFGAVGFLLMTACANVLALLMARAIRRRREMAVRAALGAGPRALLRALMTETLLLALVSGVASYLVALWGVDALMALGGESIPRPLDLHPDARVLGFTAAISLLLGVAVGVGPVLHALRTPTLEALQESIAVVGGRRPHRAQSAVVIAQVALALLLTVGAGLMIRSLDRLLARAPGIADEGVLAVRVRLPTVQYPNDEARAAFARDLLERLAAIPGVAAAGAANPGPMTGNWGMGVSTHALMAGDPISIADHNVVSPEFFSALGIPTVAGRTFGPADDARAPRVIVLSVSVARHFFGDESPIGKTVKLGGPSNLVGDGFAKTTPHTVVGVVGDVRARGFLRDSPGQIYVPFAQRPWTSLMVYLKTPLPPKAVGAAVRAELAKLDPALVAADLRPMAEVVGRSLVGQKFTAVLFGVFAGVALLLAAMGVYGLVGFVVAQRTREIGIRVALGARRGDVVKLVVGRVAVLVGVGVALGLAGALALGRVVAGLLAGMSPVDPLTLTIVPVLVAGVAIAACTFPLRRALTVPPISALRSS